METKIGSAMNRREFTVVSALAMLAGVVITVTDCGSSSSPTTAGGPAPTGDVTGAISANHGHVAVITRAQLTAANALALDIHGTATHTHTVSLAQAELGQIATGARVAKESTTDSGHSHTVTFN